MSSASQFPISSDDVRELELESIKQRRGAAGLTKSGSARDNLVGLALSGGGLRSATFNLGLLQAFRRYGLLRYVDYLSSVSGGGYTAGYLARAAHDQKDFHNESPLERDGTVDGSIRLTDHRSYQNCGSYLRRPIEFCAEYVLCTIPVLALFLSGLLAAALAIAILWRTFDFPLVRDQLGVLGWDVDLFAAFVPTIPIFLFWISLEAVQRIDVTRKWAGAQLAGGLGIFLILGVVCGWFPFRFVPIAALLAIPLSLIGLNWFGRYVTAKLPNAFSMRHSVSVYLGPGLMACTVLFAALPLIGGFGWVIKYDADHGDYSINEAAFVLFVLGFAILCMLLAWGVLGTVRAKRLIFLALVLSPAVGLIVSIANGDLGVGWLAELFGVSSSFSSQQMLRQPLLVFVGLCLLVLLRYKRLLQSARPDADFKERLIFGIVVSGIAVGVPLILIGWVGRENVSGYAAFRNADLTYSDIKDPRAFVDLWKDSQIGSAKVSIEPLEGELTKARTAAVDLFGSEGWDQNKFNVLDAQHGWLARVGMLIESDLPKVGEHAYENRAANYLEEVNKQRDQQKNVTNALSGWLNSAGLTNKLIDEACFRSLSDPNDAKGARAKCRGYLETASANTPEGKVLLNYFDRATDQLRYSPEDDRKKSDKLQLVADTKNPRAVPVGPFNVNVDGSYWDAETGQNAASNWANSNRANFNRLLLETLYPDVIKQRVMVSTPVVIEQDQLTRVRWLAFGGSLFLALFLFLPVNGVSPFHTFYRRMIERAFLTPIDASEGHGSLELKDLRPHEHGGPYPLFIGTLHFTDDHDLNDIKSKDRLRTGRSVPLVMSPKYCGSRQFGFVSTEESPWSSLSFAEAVAISGAALSPIALGTGALYWILTAFNLRTGLWIVEPKSPPQPEATHPEPSPSKPRLAARRSWIGERLQYVKPFDIYRKFVQSPQAGESTSKPEGESLDKADRVWGLGSAADGGYSDFLGLEPLLERRCRLIIVSDAGCNQGEEEFRSLGDVIRKISLDLSIQILDWDDDRPLDIERLRRDDVPRLSPQHFIMGRIRYPKKAGQEPREGVLVYIQMAMTGDEGSDISQYHRAHEDFPNSSTANQFFDPVLVEVFRALGYHTGETICAELSAPKAARPAEAALAIECLIQRISDAYSLAAGAEERVDKSDFTSGSPFFPDTPRITNGLARRYPPLDPANVELAKGEERWVHRFEAKADYRRKLMIEIEQRFATIDQKDLVKDTPDKPR